MRYLLLVLLCVTLPFFSMAQANPEDGERGESIHKPIVDLDGDLFSPQKGFRGCDWRGKDKDDLDAGVRPGVYDAAHGLIDNNCNGISGWTLEGDMTFENKFCKNSGARGVVIFGDSAAAAFHIPKQWIIEKGLTPGYKDLLTGLNEMDWPQKSWATGFEQDINGESIYMKMRARNLANHRDYQNLGVNGAKARHLVEQVGNLSRTLGDKPVLAFVAYIGNDICKKTLDQMTKPEEYRQQILDGLAALDKVVPSGSHVMLIGMVDGRILWNVLHDRKHVLGITYAELYEFLWSMNVNPCRTWLTPDAASRDQASERAALLSSILQEIARTRKYQHFDLAYMPFPTQKLFDEWVAKGKDPAELIEAVDGFHPSHEAHRQLAKMIWNELVTKYPSFIGPVNPYNAEIYKMFGDQGGH